MSRMNLSTQDLFLRLGATPRTRTVRADQLFRKLRDDEAIDLESLLTKPPRWASLHHPASGAASNDTTGKKNKTAPSE
ncbi:MAG: hypothetical protein AAGJ73_10360 [Pseudomonadota bacterium]